MKKFFTVLTGFVFLAFTSQAQITINSNDIAPIGLSAVQTTDTMPSASIKPKGTGLQTWNFSSLKDQEPSSFIFVNPASTPYAATFPSANLAAIQDNSIFLYFILDNQSLRVVGTHGTFAVDTLNLSVDFKIAPSQSLIRFPAKYNDAYTELAKRKVQVTGAEIGGPFGGLDSVRLVSTVNRSVAIDAFGTMTTPTGTYNVIRSSETEYSTDTIHVLFFGTWTLFDAGSPDTSVYYSFWTNQNGLGFPVVQIETSPGSNNASSVTWLKEFSTAAKEQVPALQVSLRPNPASDWVMVELPEHFEGTAGLYDFNGKMTLSKSINGWQEKLELNGLPSGSYVVVLKNKNGKLAGFQRLEIAK